MGFAHLGDRPMSGPELELTPAERAERASLAARQLEQQVGQLAPVPRDADQTLLDVIARAASDPNTDVDKLERLMALYERHLEREAKSQYTAALAVMQPLLPEISEHGSIKGRDGQVQSTYALWEDIQQQIKPVLAAHGFALTFSIGKDEGQISITGKLSHKGGHVEETTLPLPLDTSGSKNAVQAYGSSTSYGMRYTARALLNLTSRGEDDDGVAGGVKLISAGELESLNQLIALAKADVKKFCIFLKIDELDLLPASRYRQAERALQDAIAARKRKPKPEVKPEDELPPFPGDLP
jgi:hypothetical protein